MTELHHFHPARKGSGSLCPFSIYPLYTQAEILSLDKPIADCFLFRPRKRLEKRRKRSHTNVSNTLVTRASIPPAQTAHVCFHTRKRVHTRLCSKNRTQRLTRRNTGRFGWGRYHYPRSVLRGSETLWGRVSERHTLPLLGLGRVCSRRTQRACGTAMRSCASLFRGVAAPLGCVIFFASAEIAVCTSGAHGFPRVRGMGGITTLSALYVLLKRRTAACQNGSFAVF